MAVSLFKTYRKLLHERPFVTNVMTSCTFMTAGDLLSQSALQQSDHINYNQTARFAIAGLIFVGPAVRGCLVLIDKLFGPTRSLRVMLTKVAFDQGLLAPTFMFGNISVLTALKTQSVQEVKEELRRSYFDLLKMNYTFWPFVSMINFYFIPLTYRVLFGSTAALVWNTGLSYRLHNEKNPVSVLTSRLLKKSTDSRN